MDTRIGTCSECGGAISDESPSIQAHCRHCGNIVTRGNFGPVTVTEKPSVNLRPRMPRPAHLTYVDDEHTPEKDRQIRYPNIPWGAGG